MPYSLFRKASFSLWSSPADPSVYGFVQWDVTEIPKNLRSAVLIKTVAHVALLNPHLNSQLKWGRLVKRETIDVSFMVNIPGQNGNDLTFATLKKVDQISLDEILIQIKDRKERIKNKSLDEVGTALKIIHVLPKGLGRIFLKLYGWLEFDVGLNLNFMKLPHKPFGSVIISNIGSLGLKQALLPLVSFTRSCLMISMGRADIEPRYINEQLLPREIIHLGVTFDHRYFDGAEAAKMLRDFEHYLQSLAK
jgi:pyruvate/2-oxoglutarate dehydrogenase complex dihydrolipoamide acyltransferase (E2) component